MKIVFISKNPYWDETIRNELSSIAEKDSILFFHKYSEAEDYFNNSVVNQKLSIDLIIMENNIEGLKALECLRRITKDLTRTFSNGDFNFHSIPTIMITDKKENANAFRKSGFSSVIPNIGLEKLHLFIPELVSAVKSWRKGILDELENLGIKFNSGILDSSYYLLHNKTKGRETKILSNNFKLLPRQLKYDWMTYNQHQIEKAIDLYVKELKRADRLNKKREEKRFHKLFNKFPFLITRDNYSRHWYEPRLLYSESQYFEPDYGLQPNFQQIVDLSILEVKLPNEGFIKKNKFHPSPYGSLMDHVFQVNDYKDYLESDAYQANITSVFGYVPNFVEYNILMGRLDDKGDSLQVLNTRMRQMNAMHINLITYDDLLNYQVEFLKRMQVLKIT